MSNNVPVIKLKWYVLLPILLHRESLISQRENENMW